MIDAFRQAMLRVASTRSVSILRILMVLVIWSRWANEVQPFRSLHPDRWVLSVAFFGATLWMLLGYYARMATLATGLVLCVMVFHYGETTMEPWSHHHTTILALGTLLLSLAPCGGSYSMDRYLEVQAAMRSGSPIPPEEAPSWGRLPMGLLVGAVYFWSGADKLSAAFLSGDRLEQIFMFLYFGSDYPSIKGFHLFSQLSAFFVTLVWLVMPVALFVKRTQWFFIPLGLFLHGWIYYTLPVATFSVNMWVLYLAFLDPDAFHRFTETIQGRPPTRVGSADT